jgi:hypothetical protein
MSNSISNSMKSDLDRLNEVQYWDFQVARSENGTLLILGSNDFTYSHHVEIEFEGVTSHNLPDRFSHAEFLLGSHEETVHVESEGSWFQVHATSLSLRFGTVYYYDRQDLKPGERLAPWVKTRSSSPNKES